MSEFRLTRVSIETTQYAKVTSPVLSHLKNIVMVKEIFQLIHEVPVRDSEGEIYDVSSTIISESKTLRGVLAYARMKKIDPEGHYIEKEWIEYIDGLPSKDSEIVGHLNDLL